MRALAALLGSMVAGGAATFVVVSSVYPPVPETAPVQSGEVGWLAQRPGETNLNDVFDLAAALPAIDDSAQLADLIARAVEREPSRTQTRTQTLELRLLLARLIEIDAEAALTVIATLADAPMQYRFAAALVTAFGGDAAAIEHVVAALPALDARRLTLDALGALAQHDPERAWQEGAALRDAALGRRALVAVAEAWASTDPAAALAHAAHVNDRRHANLLRSAAIEHWASVDPLALLEYLSAAPLEDVRAAGPVFAMLASADPSTAIALAERLTGTQRTEALAAGFTALTMQDAAAAIERLARVPAGVERSQLTRAVATGYASTNADAAIAWMKALDPPSTVAREGIVDGLFSAHPERAIDFVVAEISEGAATRLALGLDWSALDPGTVIGSEFFAQLAGAVASTRDASSQASLQMITASWVETDPEGALTWAVARGEPAVVRQIGEEIGSQDIGLALAYAERLAPEQRSEWIAHAAIGYAKHDPMDAIRVLDQLRGHTLYEAALGGVINAVAVTHPQIAAQIVERGGETVPAEAIQNLASRWVMSEPAAAARWATGLYDPEQRSLAVGNVMANWAAFNPHAAGRWAQSLPAGPVRDTALRGVVTNALINRFPVERAWLDAFADSELRQQVIVGTGLPMQGDARELRWLIDEYVTDPTLRERGELVLENNAGFRRSPGTTTIQYQ